VSRLQRVRAAEICRDNSVRHLLIDGPQRASPLDLTRSIPEFRDAFLARYGRNTAHYLRDLPGLGGRVRARPAPPANRAWLIGSPAIYRVGTR
jgi:hypothetical protein